MEKTRVCVVGSGVSGLGAAWLLSQRHDVEVTMFEERHQAGGHANTVEVRPRAAPAARAAVAVTSGLKPAFSSLLRRPAD